MAPQIVWCYLDWEVLAELRFMGFLDDKIVWRGKSGIRLLVKVRLTAAGNGLSHGL
jgi:hypothetical protein